MFPSGFPITAIMIATSQPSLEVNTTQTRRTQPLVHLVAGASGGAATSLLTSPLDVLRTRLQSDLYLPSSRSTVASQAPRSRLYITPLGHVFETFDILRSIKNNEGWRGLFRGIGPSLAGVVPATAIKFYVYGNTKLLAARYLNYKEDDPIVHAHAAVAASIATATATNPVWLVKTRLQLDRSRAIRGTTVRQYTGSLDCVQKVLRKEGIPGLYRGLSASYLGTVETVLHLVLYEKLKVLFQAPFLSHRPRRNPHPGWEELGRWVSTSGAAGCAKFAAVLVTYPHEVIRTRLRQAPTENGRPTYTGLGQCFNLVWKQEGWRGLYGGLTPHLVRSIPSAIITLGVYEFVLRIANSHSV
ncbi:mitochondrial substrate carrier [Colletotrichum godetiae]|uniref:Mitochondrial substrate carrier n=1 Tax=Colletotrichum godetiae TaxID=1209918 RepID=A0AAJ0EPF3_9PEZI|nr:mitochondrial substrate carrier [Colletotrichum godetiae]KAK1658517.1 mitochondrial substrate carrier [Colletotrichum godetiae]